MGWIFMVGGGFALMDAFGHAGDNLTNKQEWQVGVSIAVILIGALMQVFGDD